MTITQENEPSFPPNLGETVLDENTVETINPDVAHNQELVTTHAAAMKKILSDMSADNAAWIDRAVEDAGEVEGVRWQCMQRLGKQQYVRIVDLSFPEGDKMEAVVRSTRGNFSTYYTAYPAVRRFFPHLYMSEPFQAVSGRNETMLVIEKVEGLHGDSRNDTEIEQFDELVAQPEKFEQLCQDMFQAIDALLQEPLEVRDITPSHGHNIYYNTQTGRFQLFDVDTLATSDASHLEKFIQCIEPGQMMYEAPRHQRQVAFITRMLQLYFAKYPDAESFSNESEEINFTRYSTAENPQEGDTLIRPEDSEYEAIYRRSINRRGTMGRPHDSLPILRATPIRGKYMSHFDASFLGAVERNDTEQVRTFLNEGDGRQKMPGQLLTRDFIEF